MSSPSRRRATVNSKERDPVLTSIEAPSADDRGIPKYAGAVSIQGAQEGHEQAVEAFRPKPGMIDRIDRYVEGLRGNAESRLHAHQVDVMLDLADFIRNPSLDEHGAPETWGYVKLPTGSGKTVVFSTLAGVLSKRIEGEKTPKGLILVPKLGLVSQTKGENSIDGKERGLAAFAPDVSVSSYTGDYKSLAGDVVVMTYQSLLGAVRTGKVTEGMFDYIFCDEAHRALGPKRSEALEVIAGTTPIIGFTASTDFERKSVTDKFSAEIHSTDLREAIELGWLSPVRAIAVDTKVELSAMHGGKDFLDDELEALITNEWRNNKALQFAKDFVSEGQQGLISCVPGNDLAHARMMASQLSEMDVVDKVSGELRKIRAVVVDGKMDDKVRDKIYKDYELGLIDVLTYVDLLTEGWDSDAAQFLINLRPTASPVNAIQRLGRILRRAAGKIATVVEFIDRTQRPIFTFWHAMGEDNITQGKIYSSEEDDDDIAGDLKGTIDVKEHMQFSEEITALIAEIDHVAVKDLVVERQIIEPANDDDLLLRDVLYMHRMSRRFFGKIVSALQDEGIDIGVYLKQFNGVAQQAISRDSYNQIQHILDQHNTYMPENAVPLARIRDKYKLSFDMMMKILQGCPEVTLGEQRMVHGYSGRAPILAYYVRLDDVATIETACEAHLQAKADKLNEQGLVEPMGKYDVTNKDVHTTFGISRNQLDVFIASLKPEDRPQVCIDTTNPARVFKYFKMKDLSKLLGMYIKAKDKAGEKVDALFIDNYTIRNQIASKFPNPKDRLSYADLTEFALGIPRLKKLLVGVKTGNAVEHRVPILFMREFCDLLVTERRKALETSRAR